jgi:8-amino-7-oxononanoate synthase
MYRANFIAEWHESLTQIDTKGLRRVMRPLESGALPKVRREGQDLLNLSSNNYLGLATDSRVKSAARQAIDRWGLGAGSARLIVGTFDIHSDLEKALAKFKTAEASLVFAAGYAGGLAVLSSILSPGDTAFYDALSHGCLVEGCRMVHARARFFGHSDPNHLEQLLRRDLGRGRRVIVTEGVFSMDGDLAPLPDLLALAERYDAILVVDDAHGSGTVGPNGYGTVAHFGLEGKIPVQIGTLSKAFGSQGGFVAGSRDLIDLVVHKGKPFLLSAGLAPPLAAGALTALEISLLEPERRRRLLAHASRLRIELTNLGLKVLGQPETPITGVMCGDPEAALELSRKLERAGILAVAIRPPTVPAGTCRVRLSPMATHTEEDIARVIQAFAD